MTATEWSGPPSRRLPFEDVVLAEHDRVQGTEVEPVAAGRGIWSRAGRTFGIAMRIVPARHRFHAAVMLSAPLAAVIRRSPQQRAARDSICRVNSERDLALYFALWQMTAAGTRYDATVRMVELWRLTEALDGKRGVVLLAAHSLLTYLVVRYLDQTGRAPAVVAGAPHLALLGTGRRLLTLQTSPTLLVRVRRRLRAGGIVCGMIDHDPGPSDDRAVVFETSAGRAAASPALVRVAIAAGARVVFVAARQRGRGVTVTFGAPADDASASADATMAAFAAFYRDHLASPGGDARVRPTAGAP